MCSNKTSGGNFHLKVGGGAKSSGNAGDPMLGVAVSGGSRIYKREGAKNNGCLLSLRPLIYNIITKTTRWEVVKIGASPKRLFFFFFLHVIFPVFRAFPVRARLIFWIPKRESLAKGWGAMDPQPPQELPPWTCRH